MHLLKRNYLRIIALHLLYITLPMQYIHKIYLLPNITSFLNGKKKQYKSVKTWNAILYKADPDPDLDLQKKRTPEH